MAELKRLTPLYKKHRGKRVPVCDYHGTCKNKAYKEVYPSLLSGKHKRDGWNYLCKKHFKQEQKRLKNKLPYAHI
ncbi:hypothetical protein HYV49_04960 [Candidatus Pacearchaeota archaeon]|nr:hypothetical protein [Candidatus Pacearchaeota archaeon]